MGVSNIYVPQTCMHKKRVIFEAIWLEVVQLSSPKLLSAR